METRDHTDPILGREPGAKFGAALTSPRPSLLPAPTACLQLGTKGLLESESVVGHTCQQGGYLGKAHLEAGILLQYS